VRPHTHFSCHPRAVVSEVLTLLLLMYPLLRGLALQLHSALTGSYIPGTHSIAFVNCLNEQIARDIARAIMDKRLAAYVNILPKSSALGCGCFEVREGAGLPAGLALTPLLLRACFHFRSIHPFEIPEIISLPIDQGNPLYLKWIEESVPRD
uniref:Protein CutA n=1 Tax=Catharus ustulatus TaxID=91951 RepID=A0A8C3UU49_CATUS